MNRTDIIKYPISTEKAVRIMEAENKLMFIVERQTNKKQIKEAVEKMFNVKVKKVNTTILPNNKKKAYVKLSAETPALDVATKLGLM